MGWRGTSGAPLRRGAQVTAAVEGDPGALAAAAAAAVQAEERHRAAGVDGGARFVPLLLSGEAVAVEDPLQGGFLHLAAEVGNQENLCCASRAAAVAARH